MSKSIIYIIKTIYVTSEAGILRKNKYEPA